MIGEELARLVEEAETYGAWKVVNPNFSDVLRASEWEERHMLSFSDAMILSAAFKSGASTIWTEVLSHGQVVEDIRIVNPLLNDLG